MKKTFYEVLEVSESASPEIIEKAYKVLAKKYHPDLQEAGNKKQAEAKMKEINEAYEVLGNNEKKSEYDAKLRMEREQEEAEHKQSSYGQAMNNMQYQNSNGANMEYNNHDVENWQENQKAAYDLNSKKYERKVQKEEQKQRQKMQENLNKEYQNAYENYLRSLGYKVKHKITKENIRDIIIVIIIMVIIITALWFIPPTHDWMVNFYESNPILKTFIDIIVAIVTGIFSGIWKFITSLFGG